MDLLIVRADGSALYWGLEHVERVGAYTGWAPRHLVGTLAARVVEDELATLDLIYDSRRTHGPIDTLGLVLDGERHVIKNRDRAAPEPVASLTEALVGLLAGVRWDPEPLAELERPDAPACARLRERVADACTGYATGDYGPAHCLLYAPLVDRVNHNPVAPELCEALVDSYDLSPPTPGAGVGALGFGPQCRRFIESAIARCRGALLDEPLVDSDRACARLLTTMDLLFYKPEQLRGEDGEQLLRISDDYFCTRWNR